MSKIYCQEVLYKTFLVITRKASNKHKFHSFTASLLCESERWHKSFLMGKDGKWLTFSSMQSLPKFLQMTKSCSLCFVFFKIHSGRLDFRWLATSWLSDCDPFLSQVLGIEHNFCFCFYPEASYENCTDSQWG